MPNINAALGCAQLEQLAVILEEKRRLFKSYQNAFASIPQVNLVSERSGCRSNYWLQTLLLNKSAANQKESILAATNDVNFMTRPAWMLLHRIKPYASCPKMDLSVAESLQSRLINLPSSNYSIRKIEQR